MKLFFMRLLKILQKVWANIKTFVRLLGICRISLIMVILTGIFFLGVAQVTDAVIALGNFGSFHHFVIMSVFGLLFALQVWYWARAFFYMELYEESLKKWEELLAVHSPRILGGLALFFLGLSFLVNGIQLKGSAGSGPLIILGVLYFVYMGVFLSFVYFRRRLFHLNTDILYREHKTDETFMPMTELPEGSRRFLMISLGIALAMLILLVIAPIHGTMLLGDAATILVLCLIIWLPILYMILYGSLRLRLPLFLILFLLITLFSLSNDNKNVRLLPERVDRPYSVFQHYQKWYENKLHQSGGQKKQPAVMILSEGGGIRAAYWSSGLLAAIQEKYPEFSGSLLGIYGVSGGSFGGTVFASALKFYKDNPQLLTSEYGLREMAADVVGKDYLSPVLAGMLTREFIQAGLPKAVNSFDYAKTFEKTWEYQWAKNLSRRFGDLPADTIGFDKAFTALYENNDDFTIPPLYIGTTKVEGGDPFLISPFRFDHSLAPGPVPRMGTIGDFYFYTGEKDLRISTVSLLSARFPYVGPAGICKVDGDTTGFVDGGYFDNTGANAAYNTLINIKSNLEELERKKGINHSLFREQIKPVIIYLRNGEVESIKMKKSHLGALYQASVPVNTLFATRDAHTTNALSRLKDFIELYDGVFIPIDLYPKGDVNFRVPLGWSLSKTVQEGIDARIKDVVSRDIKVLFEKINIQ